MYVQVDPTKALQLIAEHITTLSDAIDGVGFVNTLILIALIPAV